MKERETGREKREGRRERKDIEISEKEGEEQGEFQENSVLQRSTLTLYGDGD